MGTEKQKIGTRKKGKKREKKRKRKEKRRERGGKKLKKWDDSDVCPPGPTILATCLSLMH